MSGRRPHHRPLPEILTGSSAIGTAMDQTHDLETGLPYPEPTTERPTEDELWAMLFDGACPATDGCEVEPDGTCPHGHPAWPRRMSLV